MATSGKKGKKTKGKAISLQDFLAATPGNGESTLAATLNPPKSRFLNWADEQDDEPNMPMPLIQLPTAPRASRSFDDDSVPRNGPFLAYLSNLPYDLDEEGLEEFFSNMNLVNVRMPREDGRSRGYGYVEFETREDLIDAISLPDPTINNRHIRIDISTESDRRQRQGGGRYGDRESLSAGESNWRRGGPGPADSGDRRGGDRGGDRGYRDDGGSRFPARDTNSDWRVGERPAFNDAPPPRRGGDDRDGGGFRAGYGGRRSNYEERSRDGPPRRDASPPKERPKLQLQPRTLPVEPIVVHDDGEERQKDADERRSPSPPRPKPVPAVNIFGAAKPVDTAAREREIEERLERERQEERRLREEARDKARKTDEDDEDRDSGEGPAATSSSSQNDEKPEEKVTVVAPKPIISWRRQGDDEGEGAPQQSNFRRHTSPDRGPRRDDRGGGRDNRDDRRGDDRRGGGSGGGYRDDRRANDFGRGAPRGGDRDRDRDRRMDRNDRRDGDRGGRDWGRGGEREGGRGGGNGGGTGGGRREEGDLDKEHGSDNGLTEEEEKRLAEKMPKHKPPEGPNLSVSNKFAFLEGDDEDEAN